MVTKEQIIDWFKGLIADGDDMDYSLEEIQACDAILEAYQTALKSETDLTDEIIMGHVETCVLALNDLNEQCDFALIETEEREMLWDFIQNTAIQSGLRHYSADITEDFRDW